MEWVIILETRTLSDRRPSRRPKMIRSYLLLERDVDEHGHVHGGDVDLLGIRAQNVDGAGKETFVSVAPRCQKKFCSARSSRQLPLQVSQTEEDARMLWGATAGNWLKLPWDAIKLNWHHSCIFLVLVKKKVVNGIMVYYCLLFYCQCNNLSKVMGRLSLYLYPCHDHETWAGSGKEGVMEPIERLHHKSPTLHLERAGL